jgi:hypothetical protein
VGPTFSAFLSSNPIQILPLLNIVISALNMETLCFSETLASTDKPTGRQNPEEHHHPPHSRENRKKAC